MSTFSVYKLQWLLHLVHLGDLSPRCLHGSANTIQSTSGYDSEQRKLETLKEMFPDNNDEEIYQALRQAHFEVRGAVNNLLFGLRYASFCTWVSAQLGCFVGLINCCWVCATGLSVPLPHDRLGGKGKTLGIFKPFWGKTRMLWPPFIKSWSDALLRTTFFNTSQNFPIAKILKTCKPIVVILTMPHHYHQSIHDNGTQHFNDFLILFCLHSN